MMRSSERKVLFVPGCLYCPIFQAGPIEKHIQWVHELRSHIYAAGFDIVQMPCPETLFKHPMCGLLRAPHGLQFYQNLEGFPEFCHILGTQVALQICSMHNAGHPITAILGVEHSPTCCVNYIYTNKGMIKHQGIFMSQITSYLTEKQICIPVVGINRRYPGKAIQEIIRLAGAS